MTALWALRTWLDSWSGIGRIAVGKARQGYDLQLTRADERDRHRMGADAVACDAAGGVGGAEKARLECRFFGDCRVVARVRYISYAAKEK
jgi:hypothetical protein